MVSDATCCPDGFGASEGKFVALLRFGILLLGHSALFTSECGCGAPDGTTAAMPAGAQAAQTTRTRAVLPADKLDM